MEGQRELPPGTPYPNPTPSKRSFLPFFRIASSGLSPAPVFETSCPTRAHRCWSCQNSVWSLGTHAHWNHGGCVVLVLGKTPGYWLQLLRVQGRGLHRRAAVGAPGHTVSGIHLQRTEFEDQWWKVFALRAWGAEQRQRRGRESTSHSCSLPSACMCMNGSPIPQQWIE